MSGNQEISCYGEDGIGDTGDNWEVICYGNSWLRDEPVKLRHIDTNNYLSVSGRTFGRPINGQMEIIGVSNPQHACDWKAAEGLFIHQREPKEHFHSHTEL